MKTLQRRISRTRRSQWQLVPLGASWYIIVPVARPSRRRARRLKAGDQGRGKWRSSRLRHRSSRTRVCYWPGAFDLPADRAVTQHGEAERI